MIDWSKPIQTVNRRAAKLICHTDDDQYVVVIDDTARFGSEKVARTLLFSAEGESLRSGVRLENIPPAKVWRSGWINISSRRDRALPPWVGHVHASKDDARSAATNIDTFPLVATIEIEWEEEVEP